MIFLKLLKFSFTFTFSFLSLQVTCLLWRLTVIMINRSRRPEVFLVKGVLKICSKFTREHPCRSVISIKLQSNFIEITLWHGCSAVNLLHIFRTPFPENTSRCLILNNVNYWMENDLPSEINKYNHASYSVLLVTHENSSF